MQPACLLTCLPLCVLIFHTACLCHPPPHPELDPAGARAAWHTTKTSDGLTPAAFAALAKQRQAAASTAAASEAAKAAAPAALQPAPPAAMAAAAAAPNAADASQQTNRQLPSSTAPLAVAAPRVMKQSEPASPGRPKSPNGVTVSEAELSASSISASSISSGDSSSSQLATLATGPSGRLGSSTFVLSPTAAALASPPSLPATFLDGSGEVRSCGSEVHTLCPSTREVKPTRLSGDLPAGAAPAAEGGCKAMLALAAPAPAMLAVRAGPAAVGSTIGSADEAGTGSPASSDSRSDDDSSQASQSCSPLRMSKSPLLLKPSSPAAAAAESDGGSPRAAEAQERVSSSSAKVQLSSRWGEAPAAAAAVDCDCCSFGGGWEAPAKGQGGAAGGAGMPCWVDRGEKGWRHNAVMRGTPSWRILQSRWCCVPTAAVGYISCAGLQGNAGCRCAAPSTHR